MSGFGFEFELWNRVFLKIKATHIKCEVFSPVFESLAVSKKSIEEPSCHIGPFYQQENSGINELIDIIKKEISILIKKTKPKHQEDLKQLLQKNAVLGFENKMYGNVIGFLTSEKNNSIYANISVDYQILPIDKPALVPEINIYPFRLEKENHIKNKKFNTNAMKMYKDVVESFHDTLIKIDTAPDKRWIFLKEIGVRSPVTKVIYISNSELLTNTFESNNPKVLKSLADTRIKIDIVFESMIYPHYDYEDGPIMYSQCNFVLDPSHFLPRNHPNCTYNPFLHLIDLSTSGFYSNYFEIKIKRERQKALYYFSTNFALKVAKQMKKLWSADESFKEFESCAPMLIKYISGALGMLTYFNVSLLEGYEHEFISKDIMLTDSPSFTLDVHKNLWFFMPKTNLHSFVYGIYMSLNHILKNNTIFYEQKFIPLLFHAIKNVYKSGIKGVEHLCLIDYCSKSNHKLVCSLRHPFARLKRFQEWMSDHTSQVNRHLEVDLPSYFCDWYALTLSYLSSLYDEFEKPEIMKSEIIEMIQNAYECNIKLEDKEIYKHLMHLRHLTEHTRDWIPFDESPGYGRIKVEARPALFIDISKKMLESNHFKEFMFQYPSLLFKLGSFRIENEDFSLDETSA